MHENYIVPIVAPFTCREREGKWKLTHKWGTLVIIITRVSKMGGFRVVGKCFLGFF